MRPPRANFINGLILVILGIWNYLSSDNLSSFALTPPVIGLVFIACTPILQKENKTVYFIITGLTILLAIFLLLPIIKGFGTQSLVVFSRSVTMFFSCVVAAVVFVKYYLDNRWKM